MNSMALQYFCKELRERKEERKKWEQVCVERKEIGHRDGKIESGEKAKKKKKRRRE